MDARTELYNAVVEISYPTNIINPIILAALSFLNLPLIFSSILFTLLKSLLLNYFIIISNIFVESILIT